ncbi:50S ribosomal protein L18 [Candidatus Woesearchaeota archaeon]|nr:50S ribosomal protein L18 [Candidatus Woesearchaeota archaeon]
MSQSKNMTVPFRRRREGKTDYRVRFALLKSGKTRLVVRKTLHQIIIQFIDYQEKGDVVKSATSSKHLKSYGWTLGPNTPTAYLTGFLAAKQAKKKNIGEAILDLGMQPPIKGSNVYAALEGVIDGGVSVPASEEIFPPEERVQGKHLAENTPTQFQKTKQAIERGVSS